MISSRIITVKYANGEIQKVQLVRTDSFDRLSFLKPEYDPEVFEKLCALYRDYFVARYPWLFEKLVLFHLPDGLTDPFDREDEEYGLILDPLARCHLNFSRHVRVSNNEFIFTDSRTEEFFSLLQRNDCVRLIPGKLPLTRFLPVSDNFGFLSRSQTSASVKVNASFFIMDRFDCGSIFDSIGTPVGLCLKNGRIINPPLFNRETLLVKDNDITIRPVSLSEITVRIGTNEFTDSVNCRYYSRPDFHKTDKGGTDLIIAGNKLVAIKEGGGSIIPSSGFVIKTDRLPELTSHDVSYSGLEQYNFAIQVGNSAIIDNQPTTDFRSGFYNLKKLGSFSYPPSMYPLNYRKDRAPRILLGADDEGRPVIMWLEGKGKFGYQKGIESCGASLSEAAEICRRLNIRNAINLDGGGSAQILIKNQRELKVSDRDPSDFSEMERAVPNGLMIE